jgi:hypothetical protein
MRAPRYSLDSDVLAEVGEALFGPHWQNSLARGLGVSSMTVRRWRTRQNTIPGHAIEGMAGLLASREDELSLTRQRLAAAATAG